MMDRREEILAYIQPEMEQRFTERAKKILALCEGNSEQFVADCLAPFIDLFARCIDLQKQGEKEEIHYLCISHLMSSIFTGSYHLRLDLYSHLYLLDENEVITYWTVPYIFDSFTDDLLSLEAIIKKRFIRLRPFEMEHIKLIYAKYHFDLITHLLKELADYMEALGESMEKAKEYKVLYGELWGECVTIFPVEE